MKTEIITRYCIVCGIKLKITIFEDSTYAGGHFFGRMKFPVGDGEHKKIGTSDILGKEVDVVKWTGDEEEVEYWECDKCLNED